MKISNKLQSIRLQTLESIATLVTETLDSPIFLLYSTVDSHREMVFQSWLEPVGIPSKSIWEAQDSNLSKNIVILPDIRTLEKDKPHFESLISQGIHCCCWMDLINDQKESLGELFIMDFSSHRISQTKIHLLESIRNLTTQILDRDIIDRKIIKEKEDSRSTNQIVLEATQLSGSGGLCLNHKSKTLFWYKSNNTALELPANFQLSYSDFVGENQSFDRNCFPQLVAFTDQLRQEIQNLHSDAAEGTITLHLKTVRHFHYSLHRVKDIIYLVFKDNTTLIEVSKELARVQSLLKAEESQLFTAGWTIKLRDGEMSWTDNVKSLLEINQETLPTWAIFDQKLNLCNHCGPTDIAISCQSGQGKFEKEVEIVLESGKKRNILIYASLTQNQNGEKLLVGSLRDTTQEKKNEEGLATLLSQLWKNENYTENLLYNDIFYMIRVSINGKLISTNNHFADSFIGPGINLPEDYQIMSDILVEDWESCEQAVEKAVASPGTNIKVLLKKYSLDRKIVYTQWNFKALVDENNQPTEILCLGIDITEVQNQKNELRVLIDLVSKQNTQLIEYNSILSHNIRNHVANLKGLANLIDLAHDPKDIVQYFGLIKEAISYLDQRIQAINYLSKQKNKIKEEFIPLDEILGNARAFFEDEIVLIGADFYIIADPSVLRETFSPVLERILIQLLSNCIKFRSPKRSLTIQVKVTKRRNKLEVVVKDNGIGMDLKKYKVNSTDPLEVKNLEPNSKGLGIFLAKHLTETLEGCLMFVSKVDCGTKVILKFDHAG